MGRIPLSKEKILEFPPVRALKKSLGRVHADILLYHRYPAVYNRYREKPVEEDKVVFVEMRLDHLGNSFTRIYEELKRRYGFRIRVHYLRESFVSRRRYRKNCEAMLRDIATAKVVFLSEATNVISCIDKRPETVVVQLWHACGAFKKFGRSTADAKFGQDRKAHERHPMYGNYSFVTLSSPEVTWAYAQAMGMEDHPEVFRPVGVSRTDVFFDERAIRAARRELEEKFPAAKGRKVILYAPTFRGRIAYATTGDRLDVRRFEQAFSDEYVLVTKHHPLVRTLPELPEDLEGSFVYDATNSMSIESLLMVSDICISDYSSLVFEFALFERPMLFFAYDLDDYFDWRGFYYPYEEMTPGPVCRTNEEMIEWIRNLDRNFDRQQVTAFKEKFMSACDGHATERILRLAFGEEALAKYRKPAGKRKTGRGAGKAAAADVRRQSLLSDASRLRRSSRDYKLVSENSK